ncbi:MAG TPA: hypothetical protein VN726_23235 [Hanamia sp.]|nr:hypothetical protein [Hanamia sp.]
MRSMILLALIMTASSSVSAQNNKGSLTFQAAFPTGDYKNKYDMIPTGLLFNFTHQLKNQPPFSFGGEIGILQVNGVNKYYTGVYDNEYNTFLVASWNHIVTAGAIFNLSLFPENPLFDVVVDINAGTNLFITTGSISRDLGRDPLTNTLRTKFYYTDNHISSTLRIGGGAAIEVPVDRRKKIFALVKGSYFYGSHARYYTRPTIINTQITLSPESSGTSMFLAEAGVKMFLFNGNKKEK